METAMTLSRLADWIIVIGFISICGAGIGYILTDFIAMLADGIRKTVRRHREKKQSAE